MFRWGAPKNPPTSFFAQVTSIHSVWGTNIQPAQWKRSIRIFSSSSKFKTCYFPAGSSLNCLSACLSVCLHCRCNDATIRPVDTILYLNKCTRMEYTTVLRRSTVQVQFHQLDPCLTPPASDGPRVIGRTVRVNIVTSTCHLFSSGNPFPRN